MLGTGKLLKLATSMASPCTPSKRLDGKVAIITGGAGGIGESTVQLFHQHGATVVIADIRDAHGQSLADELGEKVSYVHCDVTNEDDISNLVDATFAKYGKLDIMYNNAGVLDKVKGSILETDKSDLEYVLGVNLVGSFLGAKHAARVMVPNKKGCILFTASACTSISGISSHPYAISKYGIWCLVRNLAAELGQCGIRVNCISPFGVVSSDMVKHAADLNINGPQLDAIVDAISNLKGQVLKAEDVAKAALYLASDEANYVSGLNLVVDGGFSVVNPTIMNFWKAQENFSQAMAP